MKELLPLVVACLLCSCQKEDDHGTVIISVKQNGQYLTNTPVYMKEGSLTKPIGSFTWDKTQTTGGDGKVAFEGLAAGNYYFYSIGDVSSSPASSGTGIKVVNRYRQNRYEATLDLH